MSNDMPWFRFNLYDWISGTDGMTLEQRGVYITLLVRMYDKKSPIKEDYETLARTCNCSKKKFVIIVEYLMRNDKLIQTNEGLWSYRVEEELKEFIEKKEHISQVRSEAGKKGAQAKTHIKQSINNFAEANGKQNQAIKNKNNIYKKTNTIVLAKKENFEDSETALSVHEQEGCDMFDTLSAQNEISDASSSPEITNVVNLLPIHEQENISSQAKRANIDRGCRLPDDFEPDYDFAIREGLLPEQAKIESAKFRDYWNAKTGKDATKRDWPATWRNWIRNSKNYGNSKIGSNHGNYPQRQKSVGERIADSILDIGNRGYFKEHSCNDSFGISSSFEGW
ncbi:YdaU family protein [Bartonella sp. B30(2025)]